MFLKEEDKEELFNYCESVIPEIPLIYAVKPSNKGKLDSHRHFFNTFCSELGPRYCSLIDVGTTFEDNAYFGFVQLGEVKPHFGGICS